MSKEENQNPFQNQRDIMMAWGQSVDRFNIEQTCLYLDLIEEEYQETKESVVGTSASLDGLVDMLVVIIGAIYSMGIDPQEAWNRVYASNLSKIDPETGKVVKREDGKVMKPDSYFPPKLNDLVDHLKV